MKKHLAFFSSSSKLNRITTKGNETKVKSDKTSFVMIEIDVSKNTGILIRNIITETLL